MSGKFRIFASVYEISTMTEYRLKIAGVHYAANPEQRAHEVSDTM